MDTLSATERSERMSRVRCKNSKAELRVRSLIHRMEYRFRLHSTKLPGRPDMVFPGRKKVVFVHGCFWHRHDGCSLARMPKSRLDFWGPKLEGNKRRDLSIQDRLREMGWDVLVIWECEVRDSENLAARVRAFLDHKL